MANLGLFRRDDDISQLPVQLAHMSGLVESQLATAIAALERRDVHLAHAVSSRSAQIEDATEALDVFIQTALETRRLSPQQSRMAVASLKMTASLEQIGDMAENTAKRSILISQSLETSKIKATVTHMGRAALRQTNDAINALAQQDAIAAKAIWGGDREIDELYNAIFAEILSIIADEKDHVDAYVQMVFIAKNFERIGDQATNIAKHVYYLNTGERLNDTRPNSDITHDISPAFSANTTQDGSRQHAQSYLSSQRMMAE